MLWALLPIDFAKISIGASPLGLGPMCHVQRRRCCGGPVCVFTRQCGVVCMHKYEVRVCTKCCGCLDCFGVRQCVYCMHACVRV
jgi:hypothetical protein